MSRYTKANYQTAYNDAGTGLYRAGQAAGSIDSSDHRQMITDTADTFKADLSVDYASTGNLTLNGSQTVDGSTPAVDTYILAKDQTNTSENGIYIRKAGAWSLFKALANGDFIEVKNGSVNRGRVFIPESSTVCSRYLLTSTEGVMIVKGTYDASSNIFPNTTGIKKGWWYKISVAGVLGGVEVNPGAKIMALVDSPTNALADWDITF